METLQASNEVAVTLPGLVDPIVAHTSYSGDLPLKRKHSTLEEVSYVAIVVLAEHDDLALLQLPQPPIRLKMRDDG